MNKKLLALYGLKWNPFAPDVPVEALTSDGTKTLSQGKLAVMDNSVSQATGTISLKARFEN